ncbi:MAG: RluA family pseudouridine synthase [Bacteroidales bacterium]
MSNFSKQILFEDNHILVINKYPGQIVHGDKTNDISLVDMIKDYLREKYNKQGNIYCGVVHRLDRPVSGALVFAKTEKALVRLNKMVSNREIHKTYWAITKNPPPKEKGNLVNYLKKNEEKNKSYITKDVNNGLKAELNYTLIGKSDKYFLLSIELLSGRHHQIRVQLSAIGCPIKGDLKYGFDRNNPDGSISLHSRLLSFVHPVKKELMSFTAPTPEDKLWEYFENHNF